MQNPEDGRCGKFPRFTPAQEMYVFHDEIGRVLDINKSGKRRTTRTYSWPKKANFSRYDWILTMFSAIFDPGLIPVAMEKKMLLTSFTVGFSSADCCRNKGQSLRCLARLDQNVSEALPYLNAVVGGYTYIKDPPLLTFHYSQDKLITVDADSIAINCVKNPIEAEEILAWLQREINTAWENRREITPKYTAAPWPKPADILRLLPKTDCGQCGLRTCIAFASKAADGGKEVKDCPALLSNARQELAAYLSRFHFDGQ